MLSEINNLLDRFGQKRGKIDLSLERISSFLKLIGSPDLKIPPVIHVAGTNGKGSTIAFLKAIIEADRKTCHVYTSPHLVKFNERIVVCGAEISDENLLRILHELDREYEKYEIELTFFELATVAAFMAFAESKADYVLLETGMGGRFDATNVIDSPLLTIITPISYDHVEFLGDKIEQIAGEKAGIIKPGVVCISAPQLPEVEEVLREAAAGKNAELELVEVGDGYGELALKGRHQQVNASVASAAARRMGLSREPVDLGLKSAKWPGRLQKLASGGLVDLLPAGFELWLDGAHNVAGAHSLAAELANNSGDNFLILGMLKNRDATAFLREFDRVKMLCTVLIPDHLECHDAGDLAASGNELGMSSRAFENVAEAVKFIVGNFGSGKIYICGSLYLVGEVLREV